jgi:hypothetical protein
MAMGCLAGGRHLRAAGAKPLTAARRPRPAPTALRVPANPDEIVENAAGKWRFPRGCSRARARSEVFGSTLGVPGVSCLASPRYPDNRFSNCQGLFTPPTPSLQTSADHCHTNRRYTISPWPDTLAVTMTGSAQVGGLQTSGLGPDAARALLQLAQAKAHLLRPVGEDIVDVGPLSGRRISRRGPPSAGRPPRPGPYPTAHR